MTRGSLEETADTPETTVDEPRRSRRPLRRRSLLALGLAAAIGIGGGVYAGAHESAKSTKEGSGPPLVLPQGTPLLGGDVDGDKRTDLVLTGRDTDGRPVAEVMHGRADRTFATPTVWAGVAHAPTDGPIYAGVADVDGDGLADLVVFAQERRRLTIWVQRSTGRGFQKARRWAAVPNWTLGGTKLMIDDFDGDGRADVAELGSPGAGRVDVQVLASTGSAFASPKQWYAGPGDWAKLNRSDGDYDGDHRPDVVLIDVHGKLTLLHNMGNTFVAKPAGGIGLDPGGTLPKAFNAGMVDGHTAMGLLVTFGNHVHLGSGWWQNGVFHPPAWEAMNGWVEGHTLPRVAGGRVAILRLGPAGSTLMQYVATGGRLQSTGPAMSLRSVSSE